MTEMLLPDAPLPAPPTRLGRLIAFLRDVVSTHLEKSGFRLKLIGLAFLCVFGIIDLKLIRLGLSHDAPQGLKSAASDAVSGARPDLLDRNGDILATDIKAMSVFAEPRRIIDKDEAIELLTGTCCRIVETRPKLRDRLSGQARVLSG